MSYQRKDEASDEALLLEATAEPGSDAARGAASELLRRYRQNVYQWCFRYAGNHEAALDLAQDALLRAYQKLGTFEGRSQFSSWLFAVTRSTCLNAVKRADFRHDAEHDPDAVADGATLPDRLVEELDDRERMLETIRTVLDAEEQEAFVLRYFEYMTPDEITRIMRLTSRSGARGLLQRARRKLTREMGGPQ